MDYTGYTDEKNQRGNAWEDSCECFTLDDNVQFEEAVVTQRKHITGGEWCVPCGRPRGGSVADIWDC